MRRGDKEFLLDILEACRRIKHYIKGLTYDEFLKKEIHELEKAITKILKDKNWL